MKRALFVIIDALASRLVVPAMRQGALPTFSALAERGVLRDECVSIFPSITPAATASLITGRYPATHQIGGAFWYDENQKSVAYFGDDIWVILNEGVGRWLNDFLRRLNYDRLQAPTAFELVEQGGKTSANINLMWFKGPVPHPVNAPLLLKLIPGNPFTEDIEGPSILCLADFVTTHSEGLDRDYEAPGGIANRFGFCDEASLAYFAELVSQDELPDFTCLYCPDNDFHSHEDGPAAALEDVQRVDAALGEAIEQYGGLDAFLEQFVVAITGDHSQSDLEESAERRTIRLDLLLADFDLTTPGSDWDEQDELMVCPNMRAVAVYVPPGNTELWRKTQEQLLTEPRIDQVLTRDDSGPRTVFTVRTSDRGELRFRPAADDEATSDFDGRVTDTFGGEWDYSGSLTALGMVPDDESGTVDSSEYPNALERIANGYPAECPTIWATARLGHEFRVPPTEIHNKGSHGSLHRMDSTSPLIAAGYSESLTIPERVRTIDALSILLGTIGVDTPHGLGEPLRP